MCLNDCYGVKILIKLKTMSGIKCGYYSIKVLSVLLTDVKDRFIVNVIV
jgi:hypothetical protein